MYWYQNWKFLGKKVLTHYAVQYNEVFSSWQTRSDAVNRLGIVWV